MALNTYIWTKYNYIIFFIEFMYVRIISAKALITYMDLFYKYFAFCDQLPICSIKE